MGSEYHVDVRQGRLTRLIATQQPRVVLIIELVTTVLLKLNNTVNIQEVCTNYTH